jgi:hypothetical protein
MLKALWNLLVDGEVYIPVRFLIVAEEIMAVATTLSEGEFFGRDDVPGHIAYERSNFFNTGRDMDGL